MALPSLLHYTDDELGRNTFAFEHAMAHRNVLGAMSPLDAFSVVPYLLDPMQNTEIPATKWHQNHQQAHDDFNNALPTYFGATTVGIRPAVNLIDYNLTDQRQLAWWTFSNQTEHFVAENSILPPLVLDYPFW